MHNYAFRNALIRAYAEAGRLKRMLDNDGRPNGAHIVDKGGKLRYRVITPRGRVYDTASLQRATQVAKQER